jgi:glycogen operon protein
MLTAGDELGRTQLGNNNAYCQDNEISWVNWGSIDKDLLEFTSSLIHFRLSHPVFCRKKWFQYKAIRGKGVTDIEWFLYNGLPMSEEHWNTTYAKSLGIFLSGDALNSVTERGEQIIDDSFYLMFNSNYEPVTFILPDQPWGHHWLRVFDTNDGIFNKEGDQQFEANAEILVKERSMVLLMHISEKTV